MTMDVVIFFALGAIVGSIPLGVLVGKMTSGIDIRRYGTGNIGASNVLRNVGLLPAAIVGVGSFLQGFGPAYLADRMTHSTLAVAGAGVGAVAGYGWSAFLRFHGGSAVGTATGALAMFAPLGLVPLLAGYAIGGLLRHPAPFVLVGMVAFLVFTIVMAVALPLVVASFAILALILIKRLDGIRGDLRHFPDRRLAIVRDRLVHDRRPGRPLQGPIAHQYPL
jgi:acyl phosphate:glycerol-3-phosphate acyltransferase